MKFYNHAKNYCMLNFTAEETSPNVFATMNSDTTDNE